MLFKQQQFVFFFALLWSLTCLYKHVSLVTWCRLLTYLSLNVNIFSITWWIILFPTYMCLNNTNYFSLLHFTLIPFDSECASVFVCSRSLAFMLKFARCACYLCYPLINCSRRFVLPVEFSHLWDLFSNCYRSGW